MTITLIIVTVLAAGVAVLSASMKLQQKPELLETLSAVKVPASWAPRLAAAEIAGAIGVLIGLGVRPLGIAAAAGLTLYFALAIGSHLRVGDAKGAAAPIAPLLLSIAAVVLRVLVD